MTDDYDEYLRWKKNRPTLVEEKNHPNHWYNRASDLHASAGAIWFTMSHCDNENVIDKLGLYQGFSMSLACWPVYHMLCGFSLEVLMKSIIVYRGERLRHTHNLVKLADDIGLTRTDNEQKLLKFYENSLVWSARYPLPTWASDERLIEYYRSTNEVLMKDYKISDDSKMVFKVASGITDWVHFDKFWQRISKDFHFT